MENIRSMQVCMSEDFLLFWYYFVYWSMMTMTAKDEDAVLLAYLCFVHFEKTILLQSPDPK